MTRKGKIARLPAAIREQINQRLNDGRSCTAILKWLNALAEVQAIIADEFDGCPVSQPNLSQWKNGGFRDWLVRQNLLEFMRTLSNNELPDDDLLSGPFADKLAHWLVLHFASAATHALREEEPNSQAFWRRLRQLRVDVTSLQRREHQAQRISLDRERLEFQAAKASRRSKKQAPPPAPANPGPANQADPATPAPNPEAPPPSTPAAPPDAGVTK